LNLPAALDFSLTAAADGLVAGRLDRFDLSDDGAVD